MTDGAILVVVVEYNLGINQRYRRESMIACRERNKMVVAINKVDQAILSLKHDGETIY
jgi:translation elongation factor EF-G